MEVKLSYDLSPRYDMNAYGSWAKKSADVMKSQPGIVEFRGNRSVFGTPRVRTSSVWHSRKDWEEFSESPVWHSIETELRGFASRLMLEFRGH